MSEAKLSIEHVILEELRGLRSQVNDITLEHAQRLSSLEADNHAVMGNGNPGRLAAIESDVSKLKGWRWYVMGVCLGGSTVISSVFAVVKIFKR